MVVASAAVQLFVKDRVLMEYFQEAHGIFCYTNKEKTIKVSIIETPIWPSYANTSFVCYHFYKINLHFMIEFNQCIDRYYVDKLSFDEQGEFVQVEMVEVFKFSTAPTLLYLCKKFIEETFDLQQMKNLKEIVPEM